MENNSQVLKIFMIPQQFPCGVNSSCCGPIGLAEEEVNFLVNTAKKIFPGEIKVMNLLEKNIQKNNRNILALISSLGWGCLPIISLNDKIITIGKPTTEEEFLEVLKTYLQ